MRQCLMATLLAVSLTLCLIVVQQNSPPAADGCYHAAGRYTGVQWHKENQTVRSRTIVETPFARVQMHTVRSEDGRTTVDDWMWVDERDHVNVLVRRKGSKLFSVFRQSKYGIHGSSLAPVGGFINEGESALAAAQRELNEELGLHADDAHWHKLGSYRVMVNRGGGTLHSFFVDQAEPVERRARSDDAEKQQLLQLSENELLEAVLAGQFQEVKWTATVALALLQLRHPPGAIGGGGGGGSDTDPG
jgi:ADP-ribose pyrophosphatase